MRRDVQQQVRRAAERGVQQHRVLERGRRQDRRQRRLRRAAGARSARAERRAMSSQIGSPDGASALCGSVMPERLGHHLRRRRRARGTGSRRPACRRRGSPSSAASSSVIRPCAKRAPIVCTLPGVLAADRRQRHAAGHDDAGQVARSRPAPASSPAAPCRRSRRRSRPARRGSERISRRIVIAASLRYGRLSNMPVVPCVRPSHGSLHVRRRTARRPPRAASAAASRTSRPISQWPVW